MFSFSSRSVRFQLLVLILITVALMAGFGAYLAAGERRRVTLEAKTEVQRLAQLSGRELERLIQGTRDLLISLKEHPAVQTGDLKACQVLAAGLLQTLPQYLGLGLMDSQGAPFCGSYVKPPGPSAQPGLPAREVSTPEEPISGPFSAAQTSMFQQVMATREFVVSGYRFGPLVERPVLTLAQPVLDRQGQVQRIVLASLDLAWLNQYLRSTPLPRGADLLVVDRDGQIVTYRQEPEKSLGRKVRQVPLVQAMLARREPTLETAGLDGTVRLYAFQPVGGSGDQLHLAVGIPSDEIYGPAKRLFQRQMAGTAVATLLVFALAWFSAGRLLVRPLYRLIEAARRLGSGNLAARSGVASGGELGELANTFDQMAGALQAQHEQTQRAAETFRSIVEGTSSATGVEFFRSLVRNLAAALQVRYACVAEVEHGSPTVKTLKTLAVWAGDRPTENVEYELRGTPGNNVVGQDTWYCPSRVQELFPEDHLARELGAESFLGTPLFNSSGEPLGLLWVMHDQPLPEDFTEGLSILKIFAARAAAELGRVRASEALRQSEERYRQIVETAEEGICILDRSNNVVFLNQKLADLIGSTRQEILGRPLTSFVDTAERTEAQVAPWTQGPRGQSSLTFRRRDGTPLPSLVASSTLFDSGGQYQGALLMLTDITEFKRLEEQLRQAQKMEAVGRLAGGVAHDFNNLLTVIAGYAEMLMSELEPPLRECASEIQGAAHRAASLTQQLLAFSRRQIIQPKVVDLNALVAKQEKLLGRLIGEDIELCTVTAPGPARVKVDPGQIEQVILNLAVNARDAMPGGGRLTLQTARVEVDEEIARRRTSCPPGSYVMLAVSDSGHGMDAQTRSRVFEPFFTTKEPGKGTGLGLAVVHGVVAQSGGYIAVESEPGNGTTFRIYFPRAEEQSAPEPRSLPAPAAGSETILLVEDDVTVRRLVQLALRRQGYVVLEADTAEAARRIWQQHKGSIDLLLTDVVMPGGSGPDLARQLGTERPNLKVLYMSGYTNDAIAHHGILDLGIMLLQKPFTPEVLSCKVREALGSLTR